MAILLAIGALSYFDFLKADRYATPTCNTGGQIQCVQSVIENGEFKIHLRNNYPVDIDITDFEIREQGSTGSWNQWTLFGSTLAISRGMDTTNIVVTDGMTYPKNSKINFDIRISFRRSGGSNIYATLGTSTVKVLS